MNLTEDIEKQINAGFSKPEIYKNLMSSGYSKDQIDAALPSAVTMVNAETANNSVSTKSILLGCLFLVVVIFRIARFANTGSIFAFIGIITGIILAVIYFTRRG
jgi:hypothetical protein